MIDLNGQSVPRIGMGCWAIGGPFFSGDVPLGYGNHDPDEARRTIDAAYAGGLRIFDTANVYGTGTSETLLGEVLNDRPDAYIATKIGKIFDEKTRQMNGQLTDPADVRGDVEDSLRRLKRDHIDLLFLHENSMSVEVAVPIFDAMETLCDEGKLSAYGWSTDFPDSVAAFLDRSRFQVVQHAANIFLDAPTMSQLIDKAGLVSFCRSPLGMGLLTGKFSKGKRITGADIRNNTLEWSAYFENGQPNAAYSERLEAIRDLLTIGGRTVAQGALCWLLAKSSQTVPIPGARSVEQIEENMGAVSHGPLPKAVMEEIEQMIDRPAADVPRER